MDLVPVVPAEGLVEIAVVHLLPDLLEGAFPGGKGIAPGGADPREEEGQELFLQLVAKSDIIVENFRPGVMARYGLDHETLAADKPSLVSCRIAGLGREALQELIGLPLLD